ARPQPPARRRASRPRACGAGGDRAPHALARARGDGAHAPARRRPPPPTRADRRMSSTLAARVEDAPHYTVADLLRYFLRLRAVGLGGPIAVWGYMHRELVEERGWISPEDYKQGLALAQLAPGPLAAQLAIYLGWVRGGTLGATLVAIAFVLPSFVMVLAL